MKKKYIENLKFQRVHGEDKVWKLSIVHPKRVRLVQGLVALAWAYQYRFGWRYAASKTFDISLKRGHKENNAGKMYLIAVNSALFWQFRHKNKNFRQWHSKSNKLTNFKIFQMRLPEIWILVTFTAWKFVFRPYFPGSTAYVRATYF